jgi:hypothetical protein
MLLLTVTIDFQWQIFKRIKINKRVARQYQRLKYVDYKSGKLEQNCKIRQRKKYQGMKVVSGRKMKAV